MKNPRYEHFGVYLDNKFYIFGGKENLVNSKVLKECEYFDLKDYKWHQMQPMIKRRGNGNAFVYKNEIYVYEGYI